MFVRVNDHTFFCKKAFRMFSHDQLVEVFCFSARALLKYACLAFMNFGISLNAKFAPLCKQTKLLSASPLTKSSYRFRGIAVYWT